MLIIDGSQGEGGGQVLRTALALSTITGISFRCEKIRAGRKEPGLKAQHLTCIQALQDLTGATCEGATIGSSNVTFKPGKITKFNHTIDIGTAGSITLVMQALLLPCALAPKPVRLTIIGGTDVPWSVPWDYFANVILPSLRIWVKTEASLKKRGFNPKGGGHVELKIQSSKNQICTIERSITQPTQVIKGISFASTDLEHARVAERQAQAAKALLDTLKIPINIRIEYSSTTSTGSGIVLWAVLGEDEHTQHVGADCLGRKGTPAEQVGQEAARELLEVLQSKAPVDSHLADNLIPWLGVFGGQFQTNTITDHTRTNIAVAEQFTHNKFIVNEEANLIKQPEAYEGARIDKNTTM